MDHIDKTWIYLGLVGAFILVVLAVALFTLPKARKRKHNNAHD